MQRIEAPARPDWRAKLEEVGLTYHSDGQEPQPGTDGGLWWHEASHWRLTSAEVDLLDDATAELHARCLDAVDHLVNRDPAALREAFALPEWFADYLQRSWRRGDPSLMGRFDLAFDDQAGAVKMLEYNADTPTLAIETAVAQWFWLQDTHPDADQFNSLHEKLLDRFRTLAPLIGAQVLHFAAFEESAEEWAHATYFRDLAGQAGIRTIGIDINAIGWNGQHFLDQAGRRIAFLHKLYPWEWARQDEFGPHLAGDSCGVLEPPWKAVLSDKAILPVLWKLFPGHPNLLEAVPGQVALAGACVHKPCLGREGSNIAMLRNGQSIASTGGPYAPEHARFVTQAMARLPQQDGWNAVIGSWIAGDQPAGIIIRESRDAIMRDTSRVVPHYF
ncbi:glutathionylspermidine synthase family protein [Roseococcus sp. YIM B11640]|uniref:glutathionylspermidine synthase family protein n=1 Tax=Roseococcus sp. YIM B11640 TaxID=3133973 RepID=UPI003C7B160E